MTLIVFNNEEKKMNMSSQLQFVNDNIRTMLNSGTKNLSVSGSLIHDHSTAKWIAKWNRLYCVYDRPSGQYDYSVYPKSYDQKTQVLIF